MADCIVAVGFRISDGGTLVGFDNGVLVGLVTSAGVLWSAPIREGINAARAALRERPGGRVVSGRGTTIPLLECLPRLPTLIPASLPPESAAFDPGGAGSGSTAS
jgi:hypothetical protein